MSRNPDDYPLKTVTDAECNVCGETVTTTTVKSLRSYEDGSTREILDERIEEGHAISQADLDCPDCLAAGIGHSKMGNKRRDCKRCNRFAQRLIREAARRLQSKHEAHYEALRDEAEIELYLAEVDTSDDLQDVA